MLFRWGWRAQAHQNLGPRFRGDERVIGSHLRQSPAYGLAQPGEPSGYVRTKVDAQDPAAAFAQHRHVAKGLSALDLAETDPPPGDRQGPPRPAGRFPDTPPL